MPGSKPKIAAIFLSWNAKQLTLRTLEKMNNLGIDSIVVDNGSTDGSVAAISSKYQNAVLIENSTNLGFSPATNQGIAAAKELGYEYVLLLNSDVRLEVPTIPILLKALEADNNAAAASPVIYYPDHKKIWFAGSNPNLARAESPHIMEVLESDIYTTKTLVAACLLIRTSALAKVGLLDPNYFAYFEDADLTLRLSLAGYKLLVVPQSTCIHEVSSSLGENNPRQNYYYFRNGLRFSKKFGTRFEYISAQLYVFLKLFRLLFDTAKSLGKLKFYPDRLERLRLASHGVRDYYWGYYGPVR